MANYPKELTDLLAEYLTDGIISEKERRVLLKKAKQLGVDEDEFDLYIDAEEQKVEHAVDAATEKAKGKLCPHCKTPLPPLAEKCPECGTIILTAAVNEKIERMMADIRNKYSQALGHSFEDSNDKNRVIGLLQDAKTQNLEMNMMYGSVQKVNIFCTQMGKDIDNAISEKKANKTGNTKILIGLGIVLVVCLLALFFLSDYEEKHPHKEKPKTELEQAIEDRIIDAIKVDEEPTKVDAAEADAAEADAVEADAVEDPNN